MKRPPPDVFTVPVVMCPACGHGIDPHGTDPGGICGVGDENGRRCDCRWSPNDIAGTRLIEESNALAKDIIGRSRESRGALRQAVEALRQSALRDYGDDDQDYFETLVVAYDTVLALFGPPPEPDEETR